MLHDTPLVEVVQAIGDDAGELGRKSGNTIRVVVFELLQHLVLDISVEPIIRLVQAQGTVSFFLNGRFRLVDREVVGSCEIGIFPRLSLLYKEVCPVITRHTPDNNSNSSQYKGCADDNITPFEFFHIVIFAITVRKYKKKRIISKKMRTFAQI